MSIRSQNKIKAEGGMSSMTDLVFLLLIFFIILSTMAKSTMPVDLPEGASGASSEDSPLNIGVTPENQYFMEDDENKFYTLEELEGIIEAKLEDPNRKDKSIKLSADKASDWEFGIGLISLAKQREWKVVVAIEPK